MLPQHLATFPRRLNRSLFDALSRFGVALLTANSILFSWQTPKAAESPLQIISAGVERSEDAPFVSSNFRFLAGDYVYFQFQVSGYAIQNVEGSETRKISLAYEISPQDAKGVPLTPPVSGVIKDELNAEDKNWLPKRRASFLLPSFVAAGEFHLHLTVKDLIGNTATERDTAFNTGSVIVIPSAVLTVQDFQFLRKEDEDEPLTVPSYAPGDTVYARFNMTGFQVAEGNEYHLSYGLTVNRPDGKLYFEARSAAELSNRSFYPVAYVPGGISVSTSRTAARGQYVMLLTIRDLAGSQTCQLKRAFTIE